MVLVIFRCARKADITGINIFRSTASVEWVVDIDCLSNCFFLFLFFYVLFLYFFILFLLFSYFKKLYSRFVIFLFSLFLRFVIF